MLRYLSILLLALFSLSGCDSLGDDDAPPAPQSVAGVWEGTIAHSNPDFNGQLSLTITQIDRAVTGTARWTYGLGAGGRTRVVNLSGALIGTVPETGPVTYTITFDGPVRQLHDMTLDAGTLTGTWVSDRSAAINGTSTLTRR